MIDTLTLAFILYLIVLIVIGIYTARLSKSLDDFLIAGRKLGVLPVAISAEASDMSGWLVLGLPGRAFMYGISSLWVAIGCALGTLLGWVGISDKLRYYTEKLRSITIPDYLEDRFADKSHLIRAVSTSIIALFMVSYVSAQFVAGGKIISETFGWDYSSSLILGAVILTFYTMTGGFFAVAWTDVFQGLLMVAILLILPVVAIMKIGGLGKLFSTIGSMNPSFSSITFSFSGFASLIFIAGSLSWMLGYTGQPHILTRYMAIRDRKKLRESTAIGVTWALVSLWGAVIVGLAGLAYFGSLADPERVMPALALELLPRWFAGIVIAAITAAIMSTADSQLLVAASAIVEDVYHKLIRKDADQKRLLMMSRIVVLVLAVIAFILAIEGGVIYLLVAFAWGGLAASLGPVILLSLWWRKTTREGALAGMISGTITIIAWDKLGGNYLLYPPIPGMLPAFLISFFLVIFVSLLTKKD